MKRAARILGGLALSGAFLALAVRGVDWGEAVAALRAARPLYLVPMAIALIGSLVLRAFRWGLFVRAITPIRTQALVSATAIGFAANMVLPLRAGEIIRPWVLSRKEPIGFASAMATATLERLFDMAALLLLFGVALLTLPIPPEWRQSGWVFTSLFVGLCAGLFLLRKYPEPILRGVGSAFERVAPAVGARVVEWVRRFAEGLQGLGSSRNVVLAIAYSLAVWVAIALSFGFGLDALDLDVPWLSGAITVTLFVAVAISVPGGPGFVGMFQAGCVMALRIYEVSPSVAFSYSVLVHVLQFVCVVGFGLVFFLREGLSMREVGTVSGEPGREDGPALLR